MSSEHDASRREFLRRAAAGAGAVAGAGFVPEAIGQGHEQDNQSKSESNPSSRQQPHADGLGAFFNRDDAATVAALAEVLMPGAPGKPGARDAGVLNYIDLALAGAYADLQNFYRSGLRQLEEYCRSTYHESFVRLNAAQQQAVMTALEQGKAAGFTWPTAQSFFETLRTHTMEGMFADPIYGGNKDFAGWRLVGFPGAQPIFTSTDMQSKQAFTRVPVIGLQGQARKA
jgi:gluconate 2-dehydrogenase gamma chain